MDRTELIINAVLDKFGSGTNVYFSSDILTAAGIDEDTAKNLLEQFKQNINETIPDD